MRHRLACVAYPRSSPDARDDIVAPTLADPLARAGTVRRSVVRSGGTPGRCRTGGPYCGSTLLVGHDLLRSRRGAEVALRGHRRVGDVASPSRSRTCATPTSSTSTWPADSPRAIFPYTPTDDLPASAQPNAATEERPAHGRVPGADGRLDGRGGVGHARDRRNPDLDGVPHADVQVRRSSAQYDSGDLLGRQRRRLLHHVAARAGLAGAARNAEDHGTRCTSRRTGRGADGDDQLGHAGARPSWPGSSGPGRPEDRCCTGIFIGLGTATKLYPLFFLGPLLVLCLRERKMDDLGQDGRSRHRRLAVSRPADLLLVP